MNEFATMKEIGQLFGVSSHVIGRRLKDLGFRTMGGKPSAKAFQAGMVLQKHTFDYANYLWAWSVPKTVGVLEQAGLKRLPPAVSR